MNTQKTISIVGAGGKTSLLYSLAHELQQKGNKVLVTTTTKIYRPVTNSYALVVTPSSFAEVSDPWDGHSILIAGDISPENPEKLCVPPDTMFRVIVRDADYVLCESDGSKHHPIKFPAAWEPVLLPETDIGIVVMGLSALNQPLCKVCHRYSLAATYLGVDDDHLVRKEEILGLCGVYLKELLAHLVPSVSFLFNQFENEIHADVFRYLKEHLIKKGAADVNFSNLAAPDIL